MMHTHKTSQNYHTTIQIPYNSQQIINSKGCTCNRLMYISCSGCNCSTKNNTSSKNLQMLIEEIQQSFNEQTNQLKSQILTITQLHKEKIEIKDSEIAFLQKRIQKLQVQLQQERQINKKNQMQLDKAQNQKDIIFKAKLAQHRRAQVRHQKEINDLKSNLMSKTQEIMKLYERLKSTQAFNQESVIKAENAIKRINQELQNQIKLNHLLKTQNQTIMTENKQKQTELRNDIIYQQNESKLQQIQCLKLESNITIYRKEIQLLILQKSMIQEKLILLEKIHVETQQKLRNTLAHNSILSNDINRILSQFSRLKSQKYANYQIIQKKQNTFNCCRNPINEYIFNKQKITHKPIQIVEFCHQCNNQHLPKNLPKQQYMEKKEKDNQNVTIQQIKQK